MATPPTTSTIKVALAGAGWAGQVHTLAAAAVAGITIPAVATRSLESARAFAELVGGEGVGIEELPDGADAVVVATPPTSHADIAVAMLERGVPVLVEKPLACTLAEADAIVDAAQRNGVAACYAENLLFAPALDLAAAKRATLGPLEHLSVRTVQPTPDWGHFADDLTVGGALFDLGPHALAVLMVLAGEEPVALRAKLDSSRADGADDTARVEVRFASDLIAAVDVAWGGEVVDWSAQAAASDGVVRVEFQPNLAVEFNGEPVPLASAVPSGSDVDDRVFDYGYQPQLDGFVGVVKGRGGRVAPVGFGRSVLDMICAAYASAGQESAEVPLPFPGPRNLTPMQLWKG